MDTSFITALGGRHLKTSRHLQAGWLSALQALILLEAIANSINGPDSVKNIRHRCPLEFEKVSIPSSLGEKETKIVQTSVTEQSFSDSI